MAAAALVPLAAVVVPLAVLVAAWRRHGHERTVGFLPHRAATTDATYAHALGLPSEMPTLPQVLCGASTLCSAEVWPHAAARLPLGAPVIRIRELVTWQPSQPAWGL